MKFKVPTNWLHFVYAGAIAYGVTLVISVIFALMITSSISLDGGMAFPLATQIVMLAHGGALGGSVSALIAGGSASISMFFPLVFVLGIASAVGLRLSRKFSISEDASEKRTSSLIFAAVYSFLALIVALVAPVKPTASVGLPVDGLDISISAAGFIPVVIMFIAGFVGFAFPEALSKLPLHWRNPVLVSLALSLSLWVVFSVIVTIWGFFQLSGDGAPAQLAIVFGGWAGFALLLGAFGVPIEFRISESLTAVFSWFSDVSDFSVSIFSTPLLLIGTLLGLMGIVLAGIALFARRPKLIPAGKGWLPTVVVFTILGLVIQFAGQLIINFSGSFFGSSSSGSSSVGPALWGFLLFSLVGVLVEVSAFYLSPWILGAVPALSVIGVWSRKIGFISEKNSEVIATDTLNLGNVSEDKSATSGEDNSPESLLPDLKSVERKPLTPKAKRGLLIGGIAALVLIATSVVVGVLKSTIFSAEAVASDFIHAVADGNFEHASDVAGLETSPLMTNAVGKAMTSRISDISVGTATSSSGADTYVPVSYSLDGQRADVTIGLAKTGTDWLFFDHWEIISSPVSAVNFYGSDTSKLSVGGASVGAINPENPTMDAFPGVYSFEIPVTNFTQKFTTETVLGYFEETTEVFLAPQPTEEAISDSNQLITDWLNECAAATTVDTPDGCPFSLYAWDESKYSGITYTITQMPKFEYSEDGFPLNVSSTTGKVRIDYTYTGYSSSRADSDNQSFDVWGYVAIEEDELVFYPESSAGYDY